MTAHKHAEMIKAKVNNMELVVFVEATTGYWQETDSLPTVESYNYFLCLPQHKEACLHWLNGGDVKGKSYGDWVSFTLPESIHWNLSTAFMGDEWEIKIKPSKEKRWIAIRRSDLFVEDQLFHSVESATSQGYPGTQWQLHEIEVEV